MFATESGVEVLEATPEQVIGTPAWSPQRGRVGGVRTEVFDGDSRLVAHVVQHQAVRHPGGGTS
jgi:hypothetical protein